MPNNNVAILSIMSKFDEKSAREAAQRADKVYEEALSDIGNVNFDKKLIENFDKAMNLLKNKFKKVNLSSYTNSLLDSIFSDKDIKEKSKDIELFINKIEMLKKASSGQDINAFNTFSAKQIDALILRTEKLAQKQEEINEKTREYNREATKIAKANRSISTIDKNYGNQDYSETLESLKKSLGTEKEFTAEQNQSIENLAKMVNLYQAMEKSEPQKGTAEAIRYSKDLLAVTQKIKEERDKIDSFSQKGASTYITNNGLSSIDKVSDYTVNKSKEDFVKASLSNLKSQEAKLQSELTTYISESVQKNLAKVSKEVDAVVDKAEKRVENLQNKIESLQTKSTNTGSDNSIIGGIVSDSDIKSLEEIEDRLYAISDLDAEGEATKQQLKEYIQLYKQYEQLIASDSTVKFDPGLKEEYDFIVESDSKLKKYADTLDETISKQKELNKVKSNENEVSVDTQTEQLAKQEEQIKETIQAEKQLQDTQEKVSSNTKISVDAEQAIADINKIKESLNSIPEEKNIKITISDSDYTNTPLLSDAEGNTITAFRGVVGEWSGLINQDGIGFFTDKLKLAADYADSLAESGKVYQANLSFKNPLEVEGNGAKWDEIDFNGVKKTTDEIVELAKQLGHDGVIFKNIRDGFTDTDEDISNVMVALNAAQIKNEQVIGAVKAGTGEMVDVASKIDNATDTATNSTVESQNKIQEELKETQKVAEQVSEAMSNVGSDKSNISSRNSIIEDQNKIQEEIKETRESLHLLSDEYGNLIYANRGVNHTIGAGLNSNRYHGGTFWTISKELAANYGSKIEVANLSMNKPFEIDNKGYNWDEIELYYNQLEELKKYVEKVKSKTEEIQIAISNIADPEEGFKLPTFDIDNEGNILSFGENSIEYIDSIEKLRDALWGCVDLGDPKIQQSITNLYDCLQTYARMNQLLNKGELNTNEVVEIAKNLGYDGVIFKNIMDGSDEVTDIFVTLEQNQVHYVETLDNIAIKEELAKSKAEKIANSRKELYNNLKNLSDSDLNTIVSDFQIGVVPNIWEEFLSTQDFNDSFDNIKANLLKYVSDLKSEFSENLSKIDSPIKDVLSNISSENVKLDETISSTSKIEDNMSNVKILTDNFGKALDPVLSKFLELNTLTDKNGNIYRLFHNSPEIFDKFDTSKSGSNQGMALGAGNYLALSQSGEYNSEAYGKYQTQWYALVKKAFDINAGDAITQAEADVIAKKFFGGIEEGFGAYISRELAGKGASKQVEILKDAAEKAKTTIGDIFNSIGYDAIKDGAEINVFNPDNIVRASEAVLDISQQPFQNIIELSTKLHTCNQEIQELQKRASTLESYDFNGKSKEEAQKMISDLDNKIQLDKLMGTGWISGYEDKENLTKMAAAYEQMYGEALKLESISDKDVQKLIEKQRSSSDELNNIRETLKVRQAEYEVLKQQQVEQKKIASEITNAYLNGDTSTSPIKDVFQGDAEKTGMDNIASATEEAVQAKKDFATANEGVQSSVDGSKSKLELEAELMNQIAKSAREAADAKKEFVDANKEVKASAESSNNETKKYNTEENANAWKELSYSIQRYSEVSKRISSGKIFDGDVEEAERLENKISQLQKLDVLSPTQIEKSEQMLVKLYDKLDDIEKKTKKNRKESLESDVKWYNDDFEKKNAKPSNDNRSAEYTQKLAEYKSLIEQLEAISKLDIINENNIKDADELKEKLKSCVNELNSFSASQKGSTPLSRGKTIEWANDLLKQNTKWSKAAKIEVQGWIDKLATADPSNVEEIRNEILKIVRLEREAGREGKSWLDIFSTKKLHSFLGQAASMFSFYDLVNLGRQGFQTIRELDTALTEMRKVSDESVESLKRYQAATFDVGDAVGATAKTIQNSTADFLRLGESMDEAAESAKVANILLNVSEFDNIDEATKSLVSMSQAYQELDKIDIVNKLNNIGNNFSISTDELARGMQNAAAVLKTQGNDIDKAIALITAGNAITQNAEKTSAGIRTISLRISGTEEAKDELQEMGEDVDDFVVKTASKTQQIIKDYTAVASNAYQGVDVLDANGNLRDTYDILLDIAKVYKEIQEEDKKFGTNRANALVEELAGKNRSNIASSILLNPELLEDVYKTSQNSEGSAQAELDKYLDSIDGRQICHVA